MKKLDQLMTAHESDSDSETGDIANGSDGFADNAGTISLDKAAENKIKTALQSGRHATEDDDERGVLYIGHLPFGFYEKQLREYLSQFGEVTRVRVSRSKKTGRAKGYAFVEFKYKEVAEVVQETMDKYLMFGRMLDCKLMAEDDIHPALFKGANSKFRRINWTEMAKRTHNRERSKSDEKRRSSRIASRSSKRQAKLAALGLDVDPPISGRSQLSQKAEKLAKGKARKSKSKKNVKA
eukprot:Clim_evm64s210 gene=Clim_evmTU64s210